MVSSMSTLTHTESTRNTSGGTAGGRIVSGPLALVFLSSFGMLTSFYLLLSVTPMYAAAAGAGSAGAGVVACVPAVVALPSGVWLAGHYGYAVVIGITAATALVPLAACPWLPGAAVRKEEACADAGPPVGLLAGLRHGGQLRLSLIFAASTVAAGV